MVFFLLHDKNLYVCVCFFFTTVKSTYQTQCLFKVSPQCMGKNLLNVHGQITVGENHLPSQAYASIFKVYCNRSC